MDDSRLAFQQQTSLEDRIVFRQGSYLQSGLSTRTACFTKSQFLSYSSPTGVFRCSSFAKWQAARWSGGSRNSNSGILSTHSCCAYLQRGLNLHPVGAWMRSGIFPGMTSNLFWINRGLGTEVNSASV